MASNIDQNILHSYRTYAYHHILIACDSTSTADILTNSNEITDFQHPRNAANGKYSVRTTKRGGRYIVIVDGTTDTSMYIEKFTMQNFIFNPEQTDDGRQRLAAGNLTADMTLIESNGAIFFNILANVCHDLGVAASSVFFLIKTIFIGYTDDEQLEPITNIAPFIGTLLDSTAEFTTAGASYEISFAGSVNGSGNLPQFSSISGAVFVGNETKNDSGVEGIQLADALENIIKQGNFNNEGVMTFLNQNSDNQQDELISNIHYTIDIDPVYRESRYIVSARNESTQTDSNGFYVDTGGISGIQDVLQQILEQCNEVQKEASGDVNPMYVAVIGTKDITTFDDASGDTSQNQTVVRNPKRTINFYVKRKLVPKAQRTLGSDTEYNLPGVLPENILNLKYIFTGQNVDIIDFNMALKFSVQTLLNLPTQGSVPVPGQATSGMANMPKVAGGSMPPSENENVKVKQHVAAGSVRSTNSQIRNTRDPAATSKFYAVLSQMAQTETVSATVKIHGNPRFLNNSVGDVGGPFEYVTIDVKMPDPNEPDVLIDFWFRGFYRVLLYETSFEHGLFTQTLQLTSIPADKTPYDNIDVQPTIQTSNVGASTLESGIIGKNTQSVPLPPIPEPGDHATMIPDVVNKKEASSDRQVVSNVIPRGY